MWKTFLVWWGRYKNLAAARGLLQWAKEILEWAGWWNKVRLVVAALVTVLVAYGSYVAGQPWPVQIVLGLLALAAVLAIARLGLQIKSALYGGRQQETRHPLDTEQALNSEDDAEAVITAPEPARMQLWIRRSGDRWLWRLRNKELRSIGPCKLIIWSASSFDAELRRLREPCGFSCDLGTISHIDAGAFGKERLFARLEGADLEIGDTLLTRLPWPDGDASEVQEWVLTLELSGLLPLPTGLSWVINLTMRWNIKHKTLEFVSFNSGLVQSKSMILGGHGTHLGRG